MVDTTRTRLISEMLTHNRDGIRAFICRTPQNIVMLTGYQPILGNTFCIATLNVQKEVEIRLAVPTDEQDLIPSGTAVQIQSFAEETLHHIGNTIEAVSSPLANLLQSAHIPDGVSIGYEDPDEPIATAYTQIGIPGPATYALLHRLLPRHKLHDATSLLKELAAIKTKTELEAIRRCEQVAYQGFIAARSAIHIGATEADVAAATHGTLLRVGYASSDARRVLPHVHVMSGSRAAQAYKAFNLTSNRAIERGDTVTVQMEVSINGYWAELTRTFFAHTISNEWQKAHKACMAAQDAALRVIRNGTSAKDADGAARHVMEEAGFGSAFKHGLGHGFGFQAINHSALPVLHPVSQTVLRSDMVHNMEPAVYLEGKGGIRLNDNVAVRHDGNEVLSHAIPRDLDWLIVND